MCDYYFQGSNIEDAFEAFHKKNPFICVDVLNPVPIDQILENTSYIFYEYMPSMSPQVNGTHKIQKVEIVGKKMVYRNLIFYFLQEDGLHFLRINNGRTSILNDVFTIYNYTEGYFCK
jgi:hypothetical protein